MNGARQRILVTGARLPAALEIARGLRAVGAEVWVADSLRITPTGFSGSVNGYVHLPSPALRPAGFRAAVLACVRKLGIELIVPVSEEIFFLAQMREELPAGTALFAPALSDLEALHSKWHVLEWAADCGVRIPHSVLAESAAQLREIVARQPDSVLKPEYSRGAYQVRFPPHGELPMMSTADGQWIVQERIAGREISVFAIISAGRVLAYTTYLPRYRAGAGAALYFEPYTSMAAETFVTRFAQRSGLTGQFGFDLIEGPDGQLTLLECNPRVTSGVHLLANSPSWARAFFGEQTPPGAAPEPRCSKLGVLALHGPRAFLQGGISGLRADLRRARDTCYRAGDQGPSLALPLCSVEIALRSLAWPVKSRHAYTFDLEWNGTR